MKKPSRSAAEWAEIVREYRQSGETEADFCARKDVTVSSLRKWRYRKPNGTPKATAVEPGFVRIQAEPITAADGLVIDAGDGIRIECPSGMSASGVAALVRALVDGR